MVKVFFKLFDNFVCYLKPKYCLKISKGKSEFRVDKRITLLFYSFIHLFEFEYFDIMCKY